MSMRFGRAAVLACLVAPAWGMGPASADAPLQRLEIDTASGPHLFQVEVMTTDAEREKGLMNRRSIWVRWELRGDEVWQEVMVLAWPFAPDHLDLMLDTFEHQLETFRDDLVLRTRGESAA